jgi:O-antigen ligase
MGYLVGLLWAAASAVLYRWRPAGFLAIFLLATATVLSGEWLAFGVLSALGGVAVSASRLASGARREAVGRLVRSPVSLGLGMLLAGVWLSFAVNRGSASPDEATAMLRDAKGVTLALAVYVAGFGLATGFRRVRAAVWALVAMGGLLGALRVSQLAGVDATALLSELLGVTILGDARLSAQQNSYGSFQALTLALALLVAVRAPRRWVQVAAVGAGLLAFQWLLLDTQSRTAALAYAVSLVAVLLFARGRHRRAVLATAVAFAALALVYVQKPILGRPDSMAARAAAEALPPAASRHGEGLILWGSGLTHPRFAVVQRIRVSGRLRPDHNRIRVLVRYPRRSVSSRLDVRVDGTLVDRLDPDSAGAWRWREVPVPRDLLEGKEWISVVLRLAGPSDSYRNYALVAGGNFEADGLQSAFFNGYGYLTEDMSVARGAQAGTFLIFLNEVWPERIARTVPPSGLAFDYSIVERAVWARVALANYAAHPLVGSGFGSLVFRAPRYIGTGPVFIEFVNAHNNFLQVLSECGLLGFAGWLVMVLVPVGLIGARCWRRRTGPRLAPFDLAFGGFFVAWALTSLAQYTVTDTRLFHTWLFYLGIWAAQFHRGGYGLLPWPRAGRLGVDRRLARAKDVAIRWRAG